MVPSHQNKLLQAAIEEIAEPKRKPAHKPTKAKQTQGRKAAPKKSAKEPKPATKKLIAKKRAE